MPSQRNNKKGGAHPFVEQIGMLQPHKSVTTVTGHEAKSIGYPISSAMATGAGKKKRKTTRRRRSMRGGGDITGLSSTSLSNSAPVMAESQRNTIPLNTLASPDWVNQGQKPGPPPYAADLSVGINEYQFGRTTPDNQFVVATGLVPKGPGAIEMIGAGKKKRSTRKKSTKSTTKKVTNSVSKAGKIVFNKTKSVVTTVGDVVIKTVQYVGKKTSNAVKKVTKK
jgi:hypothetical protein